MEAERLPGAKGVEPGSAGAVPDQWAGSDRCRCRGDRVIRYAQQHQRIAGAVVPPAARTGNGNAGILQGGNNGRPEPARADHCERPR